MYLLNIFVELKWNDDIEQSLFHLHWVCLCLGLWVTTICGIYMRLPPMVAKLYLQTEWNCLIRSSSHISLQCVWARCHRRLFYTLCVFLLGRCTVSYCKRLCHLVIYTSFLFRRRTYIFCGARNHISMVGFMHVTIQKVHDSFNILN